MKEMIIDFFSGLPAELAVFLISMLPVTELRAGIPIGIEVYKLPVWEVFLLAVAADIVVPTLILLSIPYVHRFVERYNFFDGTVNHFLDRAEKKFSGKYRHYGELALVLFVGIPLPFTGAWTGALAAFVFNIPFRRAAPLIYTGVALSGVVVTLITLFAGGALRALL